MYGGRWGCKVLGCLGVGGTPLSLQIGHQISNDIDLSSRHPCDENKLLICLKGFYDFSWDFLVKNTIKEKINAVTVELNYKDTMMRLTLTSLLICLIPILNGRHLQNAQKRWSKLQERFFQCYEEMNKICWQVFKPCQL